MTDETPDTDWAGDAWRRSRIDAAQARARARAAQAAADAARRAERAVGVDSPRPF
jgi:hypothetical protein